MYRLFIGSEYNPLKICGDGTLDVPMIRLGHGSLVFDEGCKVNVSSTVRGSRFTDNGTYIYSVLKVYNSTLKVGTDIYGFSDLLMYGVEFTDPVGAYFLNESGKPTSMGYVYDKDGNRITEGFTISPSIVSVEDITLLIDRYLEPGSTVQLIDITNLIDRYLEQ